VNLLLGILPRNRESREYPISIGVQQFRNPLAFDGCWFSPSIAQSIHANRVKADRARESDLTTKSDFNCRF